MLLSRSVTSFTPQSISPPSSCQLRQHTVHGPVCSSPGRARNAPAGCALCEPSQTAHPELALPGPAPQSFAHGTGGPAGSTSLLGIASQGAPFQGLPQAQPPDKVHFLQGKHRAGIQLHDKWPGDFRNKKQEKKKGREEKEKKKSIYTLLVHEAWVTGLS